MLVNAEQSKQQGYVIAINNSSSCAELMSDFSYLEGKPNGSLIFDFRHVAGGLTQEYREEYLPGGFGYQPTQQLLEVVAAIANYTERSAVCPHQLRAILPNRKSKVGSFLYRMQLESILKKLGVYIEFAEPASPELGIDDQSRRNLIPLTIISISKGLDFQQISRLRNRIEKVFDLALPNNIALANCFTSIVSEAVDNMIDYGDGGIIGGLYYPRIGEVEISLTNRYGKFGGSTPAEELEALIAACEGKSRRSKGGGNGINELSRLTTMCYGTLLLRNGNATLRLMPDGSIASTIDETGLPAPLASVTILLQLLPVTSVTETETMVAFKSVLRESLEQYFTWKGLSN